MYASWAIKGAKDNLALREGYLCFMTYRQLWTAWMEALVPQYGQGESDAMWMHAMHAHWHGAPVNSSWKDNEVDAAEGEVIHRWMERVANGEPIQYVLQLAPFAGLDLYVDPSVLIPRPETEELVAWVVADVSQQGLPVFDANPLQADQTKTLKILDAGTGSGCIALALKKRLPKSELWGCDVSAAALGVARRNASELDIRVDFQQTDLLSDAEARGLPTVDILVSNPPYIPQKEALTLASHVHDREPHLALFVPDEDPLLFYKALIKFSEKRLYSGGKIYVEIHHDKGPQVVNLFENSGFVDVQLRKDMQGLDRMVRATKPK